MLLGLLGCLMPEHPKAPELPHAPKPAVVLGYSAAWTDGSYPPSAYDYASLTHIARSFLKPGGPYTDAIGLAFTPGAQFDDEDFDLWIDDVELVKAP